MLSKLARLIAPPLCVGCNREGIELCVACVEKIDPPLPRCTYCKKHNEKLVCNECKLTTGVDEIYAAGLYTGILRDVIGGIKFHHQKYMLTPAAKTLVERINFKAIDFDVIVPVPTSPSRIRQRGFDHTKELAMCMSKLLNIEPRSILYRLNSDRQVGQNREKRLAQAKKQFGFSKHAPESVLLVDDVITTGATIAACASLLRAAGAKEVTVAVLAQD